MQSDQLQQLTRSPTKKGPWTNMARIGHCFPREHHYPSSVEEVVDLIQRFKQTGQTCRVAGAGKSPNTITFTDAHLIHMERLNRIVEVDKEKRTITCEGGVLLRDIFLELRRHNLMLRCVPSYILTTVAGAIGTATHGSGIHTKCLADYVVRLVLVDGTGKRHTFDQTTPKELSLAACHLGMLGVVVQVTLQAEPNRMWKVCSAPISVSQLIRGDTLAKRVSSHAFYRFFWMPNTSQCFESIGTCVEEGTNEPETVRRPLSSAPSCRVARFLSAVRCPPNETHEEWLAAQQHLYTRLGKACRGNWLRHTVVEAALAAATVYPSMQPSINRAYRCVFYRTPEVQFGTPLECFTFDCLFKQWACEWAIDATRTVEAFQCLRDIIATQKLRVHFPVEFRFTDADSTALSPAHGRKTCWIGIVMYRPYLRYAPDTMRYYQAFSEAMTLMGGRPHWAKYYLWGQKQVWEAYGKQWEEFQKFRKTMDPSDMFVNGWWRNLSENGPKVSSVISRL